MRPNEASDRCQLARRSFLGAATAVLSLAGPAISQQPAPTQPAPRVKGPRVWLDMDQAELDDAYDQSVYAPNLEQIVKRYATNSEGVRARLGRPQRHAYGASAIEGLDIYTTKRPNAPINIFIHGSGAHLAAVLLTTDWPKDFNLPADLIKGGLCCSGPFDLKPVRLSARSRYINFTDEMEQALSPPRHLDKLRAPVIVAYGTLETPEFQRQSRDFAAAVKAAGKPVQLLIGEGLQSLRDHRDARQSLRSPGPRDSRADAPAPSMMRVPPNTTTRLQIRPASRSAWPAKWRRRAGARRAVRLDSPPAILTETFPCGGSSSWSFLRLAPTN